MITGLLYLFSLGSLSPRSSRSSLAASSPSLVALVSPLSSRSSLGVSSPSLVASLFPLSMRFSLGLSSPSLVASLFPRSLWSSLGLSSPSLVALMSDPLHAWFSISRPPPALFPTPILRAAVLSAAHGLLQSGLLGQVVDAPPVVVLGPIFVCQCYVTVHVPPRRSAPCPVVASHPRLATFLSVNSVKSPGIKTGDL